MADSLGWRWEFGVQVPILVVGVVLAIIAIPSDLGLQGRKRETLREAMGAFDTKGSLLLTLSVTFFILGLVSSPVCCITRRVLTPITESWRKRLAM